MCGKYRVKTIKLKFEISSSKSQNLNFNKSCFEKFKNFNFPLMGSLQFSDAIKI